MTGAWRRSDGNSVVMLFANVGDKAVTSAIEISPKEYGLKGGSQKATVIDPGGPTGEAVELTAGKATIELAPRTVRAWEIRTAKQ